MDKREEIQEEALSEISKYNRCSIAISMRVGKTLIALKRLDQLYQENNNIRILVVTPTLSVRKGWKDDTIKFGLENILDNIKFSTYLSLNKQDINYDIVCLDECHHLLSSHMQWLSQYKGKILGLTGTPPKDDYSSRAKIISAFCPIVYKYITNSAVDDQVLNDYRILVHMMDLSSMRNVPVKKKDGNVFYSSEKELYHFWSKRVRDAIGPKQKQITSVMRMKAIQGFPGKVAYTKWLLQDIDNKVLVFANTQEQADILSKNSYHSKNPDSEENLRLFNEGKIDILSCVLQLSEGVTIPVSQVIVLHSYSNERKLMQRFARSLNLSVEDDELAIIHILCYRGTIDKDWVKSSLEDLDSNKIKYVDFKPE